MLPPKLTQEEFDEAVRSNVEDFEMEAEEAVRSAVEEFKLQGYSLDGIIQSSTGGSTDSHPITLATQALAEAANAGAAQPAELQAAVAALQQHFCSASSLDIQQALAVANKEGSVAALLAAVRRAATAAAAADSDDHAAAAAVVVSCLRMLRLLMQLPDCRAAFLAAGGAELLQELLKQAYAGLTAAAAPEGQRWQLYQTAAAVAALAEAAAWQDEDTKCRCMDIGLAADLVQLLAHIGDSSDGTAAVAAANGQPEPKQQQQQQAAIVAAGAAAGALRAFTTADDERPPASKAFMHARLLAGQPSHALQALLPMLRQLAAGPERQQGPLIAVLGAVRQIAANDEICKAFAESGGVDVLQQLLAASADAASPNLVRATAAALRQLANSDSIKAQLAEAGMLGTLLRAVRLYTGSAAVQEPLLGLLVAMVLRMPDISAAAAEAGAVDVLTEVLAAAPAMAAGVKQAKAATAAAAASNGGPECTAKAPVVVAAGHAAAAGDQDAAVDELASRVFGVGISSGGGNGGSGAAVQRQACMAVRNMVVRNAELRPAFLAAGAEQLLRGTRAAFPSSCKDVAAAALRDLGLDNYQSE